MNADQRRQLGNTDIYISSVAMGCWPISGMTSLDVNERDSLATLDAAVDAGVNFFDTAYCYGTNGESERLIARGLQDRRDDLVIATKCGIHWQLDGVMQVDGHPETLHRECNESLQRLNTDRVELLYLHAPDPNVAISESAGALKDLLDEGKTRSIGVSNFSVTQMEEFAAVCPITAYQPPYNLLQRQIEKDTLPWCRERQISVIVYWPLMKGLLAGQLRRDHVFQPKDGRAKYAMFQGAEWQKNHDFLDRLREIAGSVGKSLAQISVNWTIHQPGVTAALCGAKRPHQIQETAGAMNWQITPEHLAQIEAALEERGEPVELRAV
ncbi:MAG: aldo/keto reductase [Planctomycetes bacterium]|nr:aldo/keto reductase [Planctomycetota bacterium]